MVSDRLTQGIIIIPGPSQACRKQLQIGGGTHKFFWGGGGGTHNSFFIFFFFFLGGGGGGIFVQIIGASPCPLYSYGPASGGIKIFQKYHRSIKQFESRPEPEAQYY